jgi:phosphatidylglycerol:prolipoprotein diacylglycerol transferase
MHIFDITIFGLHIAPTYYGAAYAVGFLLGYWIVQRRGKVPEDKIDDLLLCVFLGVLLGGRLGYVLFYNLPYYLSHPAEILMPWKGGMSFHGGAIGVILAMAAYAF